MAIGCCCTVSARSTCHILKQIATPHLEPSRAPASLRCPRARGDWFPQFRLDSPNLGEIHLSVSVIEELFEIIKHSITECFARGLFVRVRQIDLSRTIILAGEQITMGLIRQ